MPASPLPASTTVADATEVSIKAAQDDELLGPADEAAIAALRVLAKKLDHLGDVDAGVTADGELKEDRRPQLDNVTVPTFLKYCDALGLTPAGRKALEQKKPATGGASSGGKLAHLRLTAPSA